jgi:hypothetical protein
LFTDEFTAKYQKELFERLLQEKKSKVRLALAETVASTAAGNSSQQGWRSSRPGVTTTVYNEEEEIDHKSISASEAENGVEDDGTKSIAEDASTGSDTSTSSNGHDGQQRSDARRA